jgi:dynein heavy chain, axonemal
MGDNEVY